MAGVVDTLRRHKQDMTTAITRLLGPGPGRKARAEAIALAVDGAIVRAQYDPSPQGALKALERVVAALAGA